MQKVLILITKSNFGGAQRYVFDLATSLPKEHFAVVVGLGGSGLLKENLEKAHIQVAPLTYSQRDINTINDILLFFEIAKLILKERPDILHLNSAKISGVGSFLGRLLFVKKIVVTLHGWAYNEDRPYLQKKLIRLFSWVTLLFVHDAIAVSAITKKQAPGFFKKISTVHNGFKKGTSTPEQFENFFEKRTGQKFPPHSKVFVTLSELHPTKGLSYLIAIWDTVISKYPETHLAIFGQGQSRPALEKMIEERHLKKTVHLFGFVPEAQNYLQSCTAYVLSSITEGLPYALLEAGTAGLPVIATNVGGIPEIIEDKKTGLLIEPKNMGQLQEAIEKILSDENMAQQLGKNLQEKVCAEFTFEEMLKQTIYVYNK